MVERDLHALAFPTLTEEQITALARCSRAVLKRYRNGERLFQAGDRDFPLFVVKAGEVEILDESADTAKTLRTKAEVERDLESAQKALSDRLRETGRVPAGAPDEAAIGLFGTAADVDMPETLRTALAERVRQREGTRDVHEGAARG